jgi:hypothetical protein
MKRAGLFLIAVSFVFAADGPHFEISDASGKKPGGVVVAAGQAGADGWFPVNVVKGKGKQEVVWPFDRMATLPDGPEAIPVIVIQVDDQKALTNPRVVAAIATPFVMGLTPLGLVGSKTGLDPEALDQALMALVQSSDPFEKGLGLLYAKRYAEAADELSRALKARQRQLTRVPSEIYPLAILYGQALVGQKKLDEAAVAFLTAIKQRPSELMPRGLRSDALVRAGKPDAVEHW